MGLYFKFSGRERRIQQMQRTSYVGCHYCRSIGGTLRVERDLNGSRLKTKDGKTAYYHTDCKVQNIMNRMQDSGMLQTPNVSIGETVENNIS